MNENQRCISSVCATALHVLGIEVPDGIDVPNEVLSEKADRVLCIAVQEGLSWKMP